MSEERRKVVQLPVLKGSSIDDALSGFAPQIEQNEHLGRRREHAVTALAAEIRGWEAVASRLAAEPADRLRAEVLTRAVEVLEAGGGKAVAIGGTATTPVLTGSFLGEDHAMRSLIAAKRLRDAVAGRLHPSMEERFAACVG